MKRRSRSSTGPRLIPSVFVQPGIEWIANPSGGDPATLDEAVAGYLEINIQF